MVWRGLAILLAVIIAAIPWGLPGESTFVLPFVTLLLVFLFSACPAKAIPPWLAFLAGLATDILTAGPLGYWAFIYTLCHALARLMARKTPAQSLIGLWLQFMLAGAFTATSGWLLASLYYLRAIDWWPIVLGTLVAVLLCPFVGLLLRRSLGVGRQQTLAVVAGWAHD